MSDTDPYPECLIAVDVTTTYLVSVPLVTPDIGPQSSVDAHNRGDLPDTLDGVDWRSAITGDSVARLPESWEIDERTRQARR